MAGLPNPNWGAVVTAFIVRSDPALDAAAIDAFRRASDVLAGYIRPKTNPSGKVLKGELVARHAPERAA